MFKWYYNFDKIAIKIVFDYVNVQTWYVDELCIRLYILDTFYGNLNIICKFKI